MVKAAVMAGNHGGLHKSRKEVDVDGDYGMPFTHPAVIFPTIGLCIFLTLTLVCCICNKYLPKEYKCFGKESAGQDLELQLGRRKRSRSSRHQSESNSSCGGGVAALASTSSSQNETIRHSSIKRSHSSAEQNKGKPQRNMSLREAIKLRCQQEKENSAVGTPTLVLPEYLQNSRNFSIYERNLQKV